MCIHTEFGVARGEGYCTPIKWVGVCAWRVTSYLLCSSTMAPAQHGREDNPVIISPAFSQLFPVLAQCAPFLLEYAHTSLAVYIKYTKFL